MISKIPDLEWRNIFYSQKDADYWSSLDLQLTEAYQNHVVFPESDEIFSAFHLCSFQEVKIVIIGQDPYHGPDQAHGLSFSVRPGVAIPPSLRNIYRCIKNDYPQFTYHGGNLNHWSKQGMLMLNSTLTVEKGEAGSHRHFGWEHMTSNVIEHLSKRKKNLVFMLWGKPAQTKRQFIDPSNHLILESVHPSPLSAYRGFLDCGHFKQANEYLLKHKISPIDWTNLHTLERFM
ncbi:MAG: uracil-DNA glycosylase [Cyclobacteriaceae bacterium]|nr:uracil-DNA glycosylase [Cyclobacteriaceae bacterium]